MREIATICTHVENGEALASSGRFCELSEKPRLPTGLNSSASTYVLRANRKRFSDCPVALIPVKSGQVLARAEREALHHAARGISPAQWLSGSGVGSVAATRLLSVSTVPTTRSAFAFETRRQSIAVSLQQSSTVGLISLSAARWIGPCLQSSLALDGG